MSPADLKALQHLHRRLRELEASSRDGAFAAPALQELRDLFTAFTGHQELAFRKLSEIPQHLTPGMSLKHYVSWIVPVERLLQKELRDDEFLVSSEDAAKTHAPSLPLVLVLDNLRSAFNVGSIFRTAECFGVKKIFLCGYTPLPTQSKLFKTAMGTDQWVEWEEVPSLEKFLPRLQHDFTLIGFETSSRGVSVTEPFIHTKPCAFVFGNERFGLDAGVLQACQEIRQIPLRGQKNSLNVGVAAALAVYEFSRQLI